MGDDMANYAGLCCTLARSIANWRNERLRSDHIGCGVEDLGAL